MAALEKRFGPIMFDIAAHRGNKKHERYFAPREFVIKVERGETNINDLVRDVVLSGADPEEAERLAFRQWSDITGKGQIVIPNRDTGAVALDAFKNENGARRRWADYYTGNGFLNCEFGDIERWAEESRRQQTEGAAVLLLTPAVFTNWHRDIIAGVADVYELSGRLMFDGKNVFPKDCRISHFHEKQTGKLCIWEWATDTMHHEWDRIPF